MNESILISKTTAQQVLLWTRFWLVLGILAGAWLPNARAGVPLEQSLIQELSQRWPAAKIEMNGDLQWLRGMPQEEPDSVKIISESPRAEIRFQSRSMGLTSEGVVSFSAWVPAWIALRRIHPGEKLKKSQFQLQEVNVATGAARELRGIILNPSADVQGESLGRLESRQTILEGHFLTTTSVQTSPDIRRGDGVSVRMISGALSLTTSGVVQEPGFINGSVRVLTGKNKKELLGKLTDHATVEVNL